MDTLTSEILRCEPRPAAAGLRASRDEVSLRGPPIALGSGGERSLAPATAAARPRAFASGLLHGAILVAVLVLDLPGRTLPEEAATPIALVVVDEPEAAEPVAPVPLPELSAIEQPGLAPPRSVEPAAEPESAPLGEAAPQEASASPPPLPVAKPRPPSPARPAVAREPAAAAETASAASGPPVAPLRAGPTHGVGVLERPVPSYPAQARRRRLEGEVIVRIEVAADGLPSDVAVHRSSGHATLDEAALEAARRWRFAPARRDGMPVAASVELPVLFRLVE